MLTLKRPVDLLLRTAFVVVLCLGGNLALAQDDDDDEDQNVVQQRQVFMVADQTFDQWIFGNVRTAAAARARFESLLKLQVQDIDRACTLTDLQKKKLELAGRGDIKRFFDRVEEKRKKFQLSKTDQAKINEILQEIQPLRMTYNSGILDDGSIFSKTLKKTLDEQQSTTYANSIRDKKLFLFRAKIDLVVASLDNSLGLSDEQRRKLSKVLLEETRPPKKFGQYDYYVVLYQASKLPEPKIKPILDDAQWRLLSVQFDRARGLEQFLRTNGFVPDDAPGESLKAAPAERRLEQPKAELGKAEGGD
jgi:hypothetical protein